MVDLILKGSITYKLFHRLGLFFSRLWNASIAHKAVLGLLGFLRNLADGSAFCRTIGGFFDEEAGLRNSIFYRVCAFPIKKMISWTAYLFGDSLEQAAANSRANAVYRGNKNNLQRNGVFYISLFALVLCLSGLLAQYILEGRFSVYYATAIAVAAIITLFTASRRLKYYVVNSFLYRISAKLFLEFWNENE